MSALLACLVAAAMAQQVVTKAVGEVRLVCNDRGSWNIDMSVDEQDGVEVLKLHFTSPTPAVPVKTELGFSFPQQDVLGVWTPHNDHVELPPDWSWDWHSSLAGNMPLYCFLDNNEQNRLTVSCDEVKRYMSAKMSVREEACLIVGKIWMFEQAEAPISDYTVQIRLDARQGKWYDAVRGAVAWMDREAGIQSCKVPEAAFEPLYSSWYNFHQNVFAKDIEEECRLASQMGMKTIIIDDGWQTDDTNRGYAFCGDWEVSRNRFPDIREHVRKLHEMGMKYMFWYSVPFVGRKSRNYQRFEGKYLYDDGGRQAAVLDPRFPEVRAFLADTYVQAMQEWHIDGFKLDFIDSFGFRGEDPAIKEDYAGRDIKSLPMAVDRLMRDVYERLSAINPDVLIEFRQSYIGPAIRQYGNMLRAGDCPANARQNRQRIARLRLTSGRTAVHSDMIEWSNAEAKEDVACTILNAMFGVVQYSAMLREIPEEHRQVIRHYIDFASRHKGALLHGDFIPHHPQACYTAMEGQDDQERIIVSYLPQTVSRTTLDRTVYLMNAQGEAGVYLEVDKSAGKVEIFDCLGQRTGTAKVKAGLNFVPVPSGGYARMR